MIVPAVYVFGYDVGTQDKCTMHFLLPFPVSCMFLHCDPFPLNCQSLLKIKVLAQVHEMRVLLTALGFPFRAPAAPAFILTITLLSPFFIIFATELIFHITFCLRVKLNLQPYLILHFLLEGPNVNC